MLKRYLAFLLILFVFVINTTAQEVKQDSELLKKIKALPGVVEVKETRFDNKFYSEAYEIMFEQPLDHSKPDGEKFLQRFFISHKDYSKPVVLVTEGYSAGRAGVSEITRIVGGNQVTVEHRFFGRSVPKEMKWEHLTVKNSVDDLHRIVTTIKNLYSGKWVSTGASKSGQTTLYYKTFYPNDVDASVPYVAPINLAAEDPRIYSFLRNVGTEEGRRKVKEFQIAMFKREDEILPLIKEETNKRKMVFSIGFEAAYEYAVLEYEFAFWQYGSVKVADIPAPDAPKEKMIEHLNKTNAMYYYSDAGIKQFEAFIYQAYTEVGYYNYDISELKQYMKYVKNPTNTILGPKNVKMVFNPETMQKVYKFLQYEGNNIIYIYGEIDTWSSTAVELIGRTNSIKLVKKGGYHGSGVRDLSPEQKELFYINMEQWLGMKLNRI